MHKTNIIETDRNHKKWQIKQQSMWIMRKGEKRHDTDGWFLFIQYENKKKRHQTN